MKNQANRRIWGLLLVAGVPLSCVASFVLNASINADQLYWITLFRDVFEAGNPISSYMLQPHPAFFPDLAIAWLLYALSGSVAFVFGAHAFLFWGACFVGLYLVFRRFGESVDRARIVAFLTSTVFLAGAAFKSPFFLHFFYPCHHNWVAPGLLFFFSALSSDSTQAPKQTRWLRFGLIFGALSLWVFSDRLALTQIAAPLIVLSLLRKRLDHAALILVACVAGVTLFNWVFHVLRWNVGGAEATFFEFDSVRRFAADWVRFFHLHPLFFFTVNAGVFALLAHGVQSFRQGVRTRAAHSLWGFLWLAVACSLLAPILSGLWVDVWTKRYILAGVMLSFAYALFLLIRRVPDQRLHRLTAVAGALTGAAALTALIVRPELLSVEPHASNARCIESLLNPKRTHGVADYWMAGWLNYRFPGVHVFPVSSDLSPDPWLTQKLRIEENLEGRPLHFVVMRGLDPARAQQRWGVPVEKVTCPAAPVAMVWGQDEEPAEHEVEIWIYR